MTNASLNAFGMGLCVTLLVSAACAETVRIAPSPLDSCFERMQDIGFSDDLRLTAYVDIMSDDNYSNARFLDLSNISKPSRGVPDEALFNCFARRSSRFFEQPRYAVDPQAVVVRRDYEAVFLIDNGGGEDH
ncbi:hypothetical protein [Parvularcula lutaonensis]|uniref:Uncharacterized protein n=1 Tax=Parvularcula lutaonensis TaxID=491923 RepID=A0ABV7MA39_9PROT|nr:hypothetical protein [Parvularcula lutaonensis]GGY44040.1 hypothetical protein GCM10007148_11150 [Parvularcula lutaonensis]